VVDYLDHFGIDPAETYIKSDGTPAVELSFRFELDWDIRARMVRASSQLLTPKSHPVRRRKKHCYGRLWRFSDLAQRRA